jgi:mannose-6-phosphate isomerase-like protein (cupin superfamily)
LASGEGRTLPLGGVDRVIWKAVSADTNGQYAMMELWTGPGSGSPLHVHHNEDESFFILEGTLTIWLGDEVVEATPGTFVLVPRDVVHAFRNRGSEMMRALVTMSPGGLEAFFEIVCGPDSPRDADGFAAVARRFGLEFFGQPVEDER